MIDAATPEPSLVRQQGRFTRARVLAVGGLLAFATVAFVVWSLCFGGWGAGRPGRLSRDDSPPVALDPAMEEQIEAFCSDCHAMPRAENLPRAWWHYGVRRGYGYFARSGRNDMDPPPVHLAIAYFRSRAPERIAFPVPAESETELATTFTVERLTLGQENDLLPEIAHLRWTRLGPADTPVLLLCDMRYGYVASAELGGPTQSPRILARLNNPVHAEPCDLDGDNIVDLVVADLGSARPNDHDKGRVVWLRGRESGGPFEEVVLASGWGRVADVRPADFDGDGDSDLIVAEFGHYETGRTALLRNVAAAGERPRFEPEELDPRPGTIHVPVHDFNGDGHPDFVALVSQEWESVESFTNLGDGRFHRRTLWSGPDLTFGSSGLELVDLDQDNDMDILFTNGDAWDNTYVNLSHGVQWLENRGQSGFAYHRLADMPGAYSASAGDLDLDGDLDILVVAWLTPEVKPVNLMNAPLVSILCLEQTESGEFLRHTLETNSPHYATVELADFDDDGDLDFAVGPGPHVANHLKQSHWLTVWWNQRIDY